MSSLVVEMYLLLSRRLRLSNSCPSSTDTHASTREQNSKTNAGAKALSTPRCYDSEAACTHCGAAARLIHLVFKAVALRRSVAQGLEQA
jgi:hypothetical protein